MEAQDLGNRAGGSDEPEDPLVCFVRDVTRGDEGALRGLYDALSPKVLGIAHQILRDRDAAEEALVDVFAQVWRQAERYEPEKGTVATWIATLARTRAIDLRRSRQRHSRRETALAIEEYELVHDTGPSPLQTALGSDRAEKVQHALAKLPREQRRCLEAAFFGGMSHTEIAEVLGQPLGTVKTRIRSGLNALRLVLASVEGELA